MNIGIIGGGASGLTCAIKAARRGYSVMVLEKNSGPLKKVIASGNGRCNYFNDDFDIKHYHSENIDLLGKFINTNNKKKVLDFFDELGIVPRIKDGYYYPYSNNSYAVVNALLLECKLLKVKIVNDCDVLDFFYDKEFFVKTNMGTIKFDKLVLASGSKASLRDEYNMYKLLRNNDHIITDLYPGLVPVYLEGEFFKDWTGVRNNAVVGLLVDGECVKEEEGEVQFTNYGVSGICVMNLSILINKYHKMKRKLAFTFNFIPFIDKFEALNYIEERNNKLKKRNIVCLFESIINYKLLYTIYKAVGLDPNSYWDDLKYSDQMKLVDALWSFQVNIVKTKDFYDGQVVNGGVPLTLVNNHFESTIIPGLYIIGELLDVCGDCGGYNLGFAWLSGIIVGDNI